MKPQNIRKTIVLTLIAAFLFSTLQTSFTVAAGSQQASKTTNAKRGKNGSQTSANSTTQQSNQQDNSQATEQDAQKNNESKPALPKPNAESQTSKTVEDNGKGEDNSANASEAAQPKQQGKREPLPFDRPPSAAGQADNSTGKQTPDFDRPTANSSPSSSSRNNAPQQTTASSQSQRPGVIVQQPQQNPSPRSSTSNTQSQRYPSSERYPSNTTGTQRNPSPDAQTPQSDNDSYSTGRSTPPVLKRESDSRNQTNTGDSRGAPPVLRRPSDNTQSPATNDRTQTNQQTSGSQNPRGNPQQSGSTQQSQNDSQDETIKLDATLVNIPILVSDRSNRYVSQLSAKDFILYEDGVQQEVAFFGNEEVPFSVALLLDMSPSVQGNTQAIQDAAIDFVRQLRPDDRVMVVSFDRHVDYLTDFTNDRRLLERAIRSVSTGSGTSVYDAVYEVVARRLRNVEGRKALILFSDGEDTTSNKASYDDAINIVTESDVLVYGLRYPSDGGNVRVNPWPRSPIPNIGIPLPFPWPFPKRRKGPFTGNLANSAAATPQWPRRNGRGGDFMTDITAAGGGPVFDADSIGDMRGLANKIAEELRHVYQISYYPTNSLTNGGYRSIRIRVKNRDDIAVRHRKGYNARELNKGSKI
jgi:Mg-chelatase subunit ChlD